MPNNFGLGILDWGIGGISIYKLIKERSPATSIIYFSDTGVTPYGKMSRGELVTRLNNVIGYMKGLGVTHLMIGCNAASTAIPFLEKNCIHIDGVIDTAVEIAAKAKPKRLGLIGGRRTVVSGVYKRAFENQGIQVRQRIAQPLSALIESGDISSAKLHDEAQRVLYPIRNCSHILLACTHYPAIESILRKFVSPDTVFIDPAARLATNINRDEGNSNGMTDRFLTTGDAEAMVTAARNAFGVSIGNALKIPRNLSQHPVANGRMEN